MPIPLKNDWSGPESASEARPGSKGQQSWRIALAARLLEYRQQFRDLLRRQRRSRRDLLEER